MSNANLREKQASKGMVLTNGNAFSEVGGTVYLGVNDSPENWYEITDAEAEILIKEQEEKFLESLNFIY